MLAGIIAGITWALETIVLGIALSMTPFVSTEQAVMLAPFVSTFLHDAISAIWACLYNGVRGNLPNVVAALKTRSGKFVSLAAVIGGPMGMTGYVLSVNNMGASIGAVASAIFPAIGAVLAYFFLKEEMQWYRWVFLILSLLGVYGLSWSPDINITNFWLGFAGTLMCAFGWGIEAVIIAKCVQDDAVTDEIALQIRSSQIEISVLQAKLFSGLGILFDGERRSLGLREDAQIHSTHFDRTGGQFFIYRTAAFLHHTGHGDVSTRKPSVYDHSLSPSRALYYHYNHTGPGCQGMIHLPSPG